MIKEKRKTEMNYLAPIEKMINEARTIENLHMLIKNNFFVEKDKIKCYNIKEEFKYANII